MDPLLRLSLRDALRVDRVRLVPPSIPGFAPGDLGRPLEVELEIDGKTVTRVAMPPDPGQVVEVVLDAPVSLKKLELRILASLPGRLTAATGLGEVELGLGAGLR